MTSPPAPRMSSLTGAIQRSNLHDRIVEALGMRIVRGDFGNDATLPSEPVLAAELGVSRNALREAIKVLARKGMVEVRPKTGTRVLPRSGWSLLDREVLIWKEAASPSLDHTLDLVEFRLIVEPKASYLAARRAGETEIATIDAACTRLEACIGKPLDEMSKVDFLFHRAILSASHNEILIYLGSVIESLMRIQVATTSQDPDSFKRGLVQHRALADAIAARDAGKAETISRDLVLSPYGLLADLVKLAPDLRLA